MAKITPIIMSGGSGTRLWPASRKTTPKQLLPLAGDKTLVQETALRFRGDNFTSPIIICNHTHKDEISKQLNRIAISADFITEPVARNTAACAAIAAMAVKAKNKDALMILAPADHFIKDEAEFNRVIANAIPAVKAGYIVTLGITATAPETGYGYIKKGRILDKHACKVAEFCEKPDLEMAKKYLLAGDYFWNAGIFMAKPSVLLAEMQKHCPDIIKACEKCWLASEKQNSLIKLDNDSFALCPSISIDYAVMEKTRKAAVVEADIGWSDIGSWSALRDLTSDKNDNALRGDVHIIDSKNNIIHTDGTFIAAIGVENLAIISHEGALLIANLDEVQNVKQIVKWLENKNRQNLL